MKNSPIAFPRAAGGAVAIEFGIVVVVLVLLFVCGTDLALGFYSEMQVQQAAQVGTQYAAVHGYNASGITSAVASATSATGISAVTSEYCGCPGSTGVTAADCNAVCPDGTTAGRYVEVTAGRTYTTLIAYPMIPSRYDQYATSTVRIQ